jgi:hypothetical protein
MTRTGTLLLVTLALAAPVAAEELTLKDGRKVQVADPQRSEGKVVDGATQGATFSVAEDQVVSPNLWSLPARLKLKDGRTFVVTAITRADGRVRFQVVAGGAKRQVPEAQVAWPPLQGMPAAVLVLADGRSIPVAEVARRDGRVVFTVAGTGEKRGVPEAQVSAASLASLGAAPTATAEARPAAPAPAPPAAPAQPATPAFEEPPPLPRFPLTLKLADGRQVQVDELTRKDDRVRFREVSTGARRQVPADRVVSPALASIPVMLTLADGREIAVTGLHRVDDKVRFREVTSGQRRQVPVAQVLSPAPTTIVALGAAPPPPPVEPTTPTPTAPVAPPAVTPPAPAGPAVADYEVIPDRWGILDALMAPLPETMLDTWRVDRGRGADPYNQNTLKGDRPIAGSSVFLVFTGILEVPSEARRLPLPSGVSAENPNNLEFFGNGNMLFTTPRGLFSLELFKGQTAFRPKTWALKVTAALNDNYLKAKERNVVNIDPREGITRNRQDFSLEDAFGELKLADLSPNYDTVSVRAGIQPFVSDFRGFIFSDSNLGARLFGNIANNRWQYNLAYFDLLEKETNSELNTFDKREQKVFIANVFRQDTFKKGYTTSFSYHRSQDEASKEFHFDENDFLVRPARIGSPHLHDIRSNYAGWTGDGHLGRYNIDHAVYYAFGTDDDNPLGDRERGLNEQKIQAAMGAVELSIDKDWARLKASVFFATGDDDISDGKAKGFDTIYDLTNFAGGPFSFWNRSGIPLTQTAVLLKTGGSLLPSLRSNKFEGQANFVNPGILLGNLSVDLDLTPKLKGVINANYLRFHKTGALQDLLFQPNIRKNIGIDLGAGVLWRPLLNENVVIQAGFTTLLPGAGFDDLFSSPCSQPSCGAKAQTLYNGFLLLKFTY